MRKRAKSESRATGMAIATECDDMKKEAGFDIQFQNLHVMKKAHWGSRFSFSRFILNFIVFSHWYAAFWKQMYFFFTNRIVLFFFQWFVSFFLRKQIYAFWTKQTKKVSICSVNSLSRWSRQGPLRIQISAWNRRSRWTWCPRMAPAPP